MTDKTPLGKLIEQLDGLIEIEITRHKWNEPKWAYDSSGDRYLNSDRFSSGFYKHAKFKLPSGKKKCIRFMDIPDDGIIRQIVNSHKNLSFKTDNNDRQD